MARALLALLALAACLAAASAQMGEFPARAQLRRDVIPYVRCQICELIAKNAFEQSRALLAKSTPAKKTTEFDLIEAVEKMTTAWRDEGEWLQALDWKVSRGRLVVEEQPEAGKCEVACKTLEKAAFDLIEGEETAIVEYLWNQAKGRGAFGGEGRADLDNPKLRAADLKAFSSWLCGEATGACSGKGAAAKVPKGFDPGEGYIPRPSNHQDMDRMMGEMRDSGMRGQLYSREELMEQYKQLGGDGLDFEGVDFDGVGGVGGDGEL